MLSLYMIWERAGWTFRTRKQETARNPAPVIFAAFPEILLSRPMVKNNNIIEAAMVAYISVSKSCILFVI